MKWYRWAIRSQLEPGSRAQVDLEQPRAWPVHARRRRVDRDAEVSAAATADIAR